MKCGDIHLLSMTNLTWRSYSNAASFFGLFIKNKSKRDQSLCDRPGGVSLCILFRTSQSHRRRPTDWWYFSSSFSLTRSIESLDGPGVIQIKTTGMHSADLSSLSSMSRISVQCWWYVAFNATQFRLCQVWRTWHATTKHYERICGSLSLFFSFFFF